MSIVGNTIVKSAHKGTSSGYFCKKITQTVYPRNAEDFSNGIELTIEIIGDKIQMGAKKDGKYFEGLEPFLNEGDIVNLVNQKPEMKEQNDEMHNLCLFFRYEGFPPIKLVQQTRRSVQQSVVLKDSDLKSQKNSILKTESSNNDQIKDAKDFEIKELQNHKTQLLREIQILENAANQFQEKLFDKQKELNDLRMENHKLSSDLKKKEEELKQNQQSQEQQKILQDEIDEQNEKYIKLSMQYEQIKKNYESRLIDLESYIMVKEREIKILKHQLNQKNLTLEKLENVTEIDLQNHRFKELQAKYDILKEDYDRKIAENKKKEQDITTQGQQLDKNQVYLDLAQKELERYKQQESSLNEQQVHYLVIRNEYENQKKEMVKQIQKISKYQETRRQQENQINSLEQQILEQRKEILRQKNDLDAQKIEIEKKIIENSNLRLKIQMRNQ